MHTGSPAHRRDFLGQFDHMKGHHSRCESRRGQSGLAIPRTERSGTTSWSVEVRGRPYPHTAVRLYGRELQETSACNPQKLLSLKSTIILVDLLCSGGLSGSAAPGGQGCMWLSGTGQRSRSIEIGRRASPSGGRPSLVLTNLSQWCRCTDVSRCRLARARQQLRISNYTEYSSSWSLSRSALAWAWDSPGHTYGGLCGVVHLVVRWNGTTRHDLVCIMRA